MIKTLLQTDPDYVYTFLRIIAGIIVFPYGMQKLFGWSSAPGFGAPGIKASLEQITARNIPKFIAWLIIIGQSFGSIALMSGFLGRIAAGGLFIIFTGALIVHLPDGWTLNWLDQKREKELSILYCSCHSSWSSSSREVVRYRWIFG
jgi:putative oxidoreductase